MLTLTEERPSLAIKNYKKDGLAWLHLYSFHISVARRIFCAAADINQTGAPLSEAFCSPDMPVQAQVIIYTRPGCHLCEEAKQAIAAARCADQFTLTEIDIDTDTKLVRRYGWEIPVVSINGIDTFKHRVKAQEFRREIRRVIQTSGDK